MQNPFSTKVRKIGTSFGVIIPIEILRAHNWQRGDYICFGNMDHNTIVMRKIAEELLAQINITEY